MEPFQSSVSQYDGATRARSQTFDKYANTREALNGGAIAYLND